MNTVPVKIRIDKYLWAIRIFKTRTQATDACSKGKVKMNGNSLKASKIVELHDQYEIKTEARKWIIQVTALLQQRVQFSEAVKFYADLTPAEEMKEENYEATSFHTGKRLSKIGRPTKKERRGRNDFFHD
ncbi:MAG: RNA-binding S4 domain-containing protein [Chitinophagaceae bacterium]